MKPEGDEAVSRLADPAGCSLKFSARAADTEHLEMWTEVSKNERNDGAKAPGNTLGKDTRQLLRDKRCLISSPVSVAAGIVCHPREAGAYLGEA